MFAGPGPSYTTRGNILESGVWPHDKLVLAGPDEQMAEVVQPANPVEPSAEGEDEERYKRFLHNYLSINGGGLVETQGDCPTRQNGTYVYFEKIKVLKSEIMTAVLLSSVLCEIQGNGWMPYLMIELGQQLSVVTTAGIGFMQFIGDIDRVEGNVVYLSGVMWLPGDSHCCPSREGTLRYDASSGVHEYDLHPREQAEALPLNEGGGRETLGEVRGWTITYDGFGAGACYASAEYASDTTLTFGKAGPNASWSIQLVNPKWSSIVVGSQYDTSYVFDGRNTWAGADTGIKNGIRTEGVREEFITALARSSTLEVWLKDKRVDGFDLTGTRASYDELARCYKDRVETADPFAADSVDDPFTEEARPTNTQPYNGSGLVPIDFSSRSSPVSFDCGTWAELSPDNVLAYSDSIFLDQATEGTFYFSTGETFPVAGRSKGDNGSWTGKLQGMLFSIQRQTAWTEVQGSDGGLMSSAATLEVKSAENASGDMYKVTLYYGC